VQKVLGQIYFPAVCKSKCCSSIFREVAVLSDVTHKKRRAANSNLTQATLPACFEYGSAEPITLQDIMNNAAMFCPSPPVHGPLNAQEDSYALKCIQAFPVSLVINCTALQ
jgi:hypothetical protein